MITKEYCRSAVRVEERGVRRAATVQAAKLLGSIVRANTAKLTKAAVNSTTSKVTNTFSRLRRGGKTQECFWQLGLAHFGGLIWPTPWDVQV